VKGLDSSDLDRMLSSEETLTASSGFAAGVMDAVRVASERAEPLRFPWGRFLAGAAACAVCATSGTALAAPVLRNEVITARLTAAAPELGSALSVLALCLIPFYGRRLLPRD
jgi:hypothetical protein